MRGVEAGSGATGSIGLEETEAITVVDILPRAGISVNRGRGGWDVPPVVESRTGETLARSVLDKDKVSDFDMIVMMGGRNGIPPLQKTTCVA